MVYSLYCAINEFNSNLIVSYTDINYSRRVIKKLFQENKYISVIIEKKLEELLGKEIYKLFKRYV